MAPNPDRQEPERTVLDQTRAEADRSGGPELGKAIGRFLEPIELARGGMGRILRAIDPELDRPVAIKVILEEAGRNQIVLERFLREARITGQLQHPGIPPVYELAGTGEGRPYFAMKLIEGRTLAEVLDDLRERGYDEAIASRRALLASFVKVCEAMAYAHSRGVLHRDLKPANVMLGEFGEVLVLDWGVAATRTGRSGGEAGGAPLPGDPPRPSTLTMAGALLGTPVYMSPEQASGSADDLDERSDIYSLGAMLFEILTLERPFSAPDLEALLEEVRIGRLRRPRDVAPGARIPGELESVVLKSMARRPAERYRSVLDLKNDIEAWLAGKTLSAAHYTVFQRLAKWVARHRAAATAVTGAATAVLAVLATLAAIWYRTPGTLNLRVDPAGARIRIAEESHLASDEVLDVELPAGLHEIAVEAPGHEPEFREILVERGRTKDLAIVLRPHVGRLEVDVEPSRASLEVDGALYGARIPGLPFQTGRRALRARADGCFVRELAIDLRRDELATRHVYLDEGVEWTYSSPALAWSPFPVRTGDVDGDGTEDVAVTELTRILYLSGLTGKPIGQWIPPGGLKSSLALDLAGEVGTVLFAIEKDAGDGERLHLVDTSAAGAGGVRWTSPFASEVAWVYPAHEPGRLLVVDRGGGVRILDGASGETIRSFELGTGARFDVPFQACLQLAGGRPAMFFVCPVEPLDPLRPEREHVAGLVDLEDGRALGGTSFRARAADRLLVEAPDQPTLLWTWGAGRLTVRDPGGGRVLWEDETERVSAVLPLDPGEGEGLSDLLLVQPEVGIRAVARADGRTLWNVKGALAKKGGVRAIGGLVLCPFRDGLSALDAGDGSLRRRWPGRTEGTLPVDLDRDGAIEILAFVEGTGLLALDGEGRELWNLYLDASVHPANTIPDADGDGLDEILVARGGAIVARVRGPRILWRRQAAGPLLSTPLVADLDLDGAPEVVQTGPWLGGRQIQVFDGASGRVLWGRDEGIPPNRSPGLGDFDRDGRLDLATLGWPSDSHDKERRLYLFRGAGGDLLAEHPLDSGPSSYCVPGVADLDRDGTPDVVLSRWHSRDVLAVGGASGRVLWRFETAGPNMGGVAMGDLDRDGIPDAVTASIDGSLHALGGADGRPLWRVALGQGGSRSVPALADLTGDGTPEVLLVSQQGILWVVEGSRGEVLWQARTKESSEGLGRPAFVEIPGVGPAILAPLGAAGVVALDWEGRRGLWASPAGRGVLASPVPADLDGDGRTEVVVATTTGEVLVLDPTTGRQLWRLRVAEAIVEADPAVADLDGDGLLDVGVADHGSGLTAIDGRSIAPALRRGR